MSDYLFYLNQDRTPVERYFMEGNPGEGYAFEGIEYWNRHMSTLLDVLSEKVTKERLNEVKTNLINSLLQLDNITDYNVYDDPLSLLSGRSLEKPY